MNLIKYRHDIRGVAFEILLKSNSNNILVVEGQFDVSIYIGLLPRNNVIIKAAEIGNKNGTKKNVIAIKKIIDIIEPKNKRIAYLVDKDNDSNKKQKNDNNFFITDYYSLENYPIVSDKKHKYFKDISTIIESDIFLLKKTTTSEVKNRKLSVPNSIQKLREMEPKFSEISIPGITDIELLKVCKGKLLYSTLIRDGYKDIKKRNQVYFDPTIDYPVLKKIMDFFHIS